MLTLELRLLAKIYSNKYKKTRQLTDIYKEKEKFEFYNIRGIN